MLPLSVKFDLPFLEIPFCNFQFHFLQSKSTLLIPNWVFPFEIRKSGKIGIGGLENTSVFNGQGGEMSIDHQVCDGFSTNKHLLEYIPVPFRRGNHLGTRLIQPALNTENGLLQQKGTIKNTWVCPNTNESIHNGPA